MHTCGFVFTGFLTLHCIVKTAGKAYGLWGVAPQLLLVLPISTAPAQRSVDCCLPAWSQLLLVSSNLLATNDVHHSKASTQQKRRLITSFASHSDNFSYRKHLSYYYMKPELQTANYQDPPTRRLNLNVVCPVHKKSVSTRGFDYGCGWMADPSDKSVWYFAIRSLRMSKSLY